jgi:hypothetical protein
MSKIARRVAGQTAKNFPIILVGIGLATTILWVGTVMTFALEGVWSVLSGI